MTSKLDSMPSPGKRGARRRSTFARRSSSTSKISRITTWLLSESKNPEGESLPLDDVIARLGLVDPV